MFVEMTGENMTWKKMLAYISGSVDEELLKTNEYLREENLILRRQLNTHPKLTDVERKSLAEKAVALGKLMAETVTIVKPATILMWHRKLVAQKFDGSKNRKNRGRPKISAEIEALIIQFAKENRSWGYDRISGALANLGHKVSDQSVANILKRNGLEPVKERKKGMTWAEFIRQHTDVLWATDFFTCEVWTKGGLTTFYVLFFIHLKTRRVVIGGVSENPDGKWVTQVTRGITEVDQSMANTRYLIHDRDPKYCSKFRNLLKSSGIEPLKLPARSPNLNAFAERWVRSIKDECLSQLILFGEKSLRHVLKEYMAHYHTERNHQGIENVIPFPDECCSDTGDVNKASCLGGLLNFYYRKAS